MWAPALRRSQRRKIRSIHWIYIIFEHKYKKQLAGMCDVDNPDCVVAELHKKRQIKLNVKIKQAEAQIKRNLK